MRSDVANQPTIQCSLSKSSVTFNILTSLYATHVNYLLIIKVILFQLRKLRNFIYFGKIISLFPFHDIVDYLVFITLISLSLSLYDKYYAYD